MSRAGRARVFHSLAAIGIALVLLGAGPDTAPRAEDPKGQEQGSVGAASGPAAPVANGAQSPAPAGVPPVRVEFVPKDPAIGDLVEVRVRASLPPGWKVELPPPAKQLGELLVRGFEGPTDEAAEKGGEKRAERTWVIRVQAFRTGEIEVPPIRLEAKGPGGESPEMRTGRQILSVRSVIDGAGEGQAAGKGKEPTPADLDGPATIPFPWAWFCGILAGFFLLVIAAGLLVRWLVLRRARSRGTAKPAGPPPIPPYEQALRDLSELERSGLVVRGELKEHYVRLTEIVKRYLGWRFDFPAAERTTSEIRKELRARRAAFTAGGGPVWEEVTALFESGDLVKFAKATPPRSESEEALGTARSLVQRCAPAPSVTSAAGPPAGAMAPAATPGPAGVHPRPTEGWPDA